MGRTGSVYLRRIELHGFKSFGRRVGMDLDPALNAVVGPNGCGKSNLLDAVRWALGEGNLRTLRGVRTQDIVFSGTQELRPLGFAEVTLTFDNADGSLPVPAAEVAVTRRAYRSGQSLFAINGVPCRLRDVHELLARAGFGARTHALVGQGEADTWVLGSGEQRRLALEEAAGLLRFRHLASVARMARDRARQDLERVAAALGEMGRHVAFLEQQAARAREAAQVSSQLQAVQRELDRRELVQAREQAAAARQARDQAAAALAQARARLEQARQQVEGHWEAQRALSERQRALAQALDQARRQLLERRHERTRASDREFEAAGRLQQLGQELAQLDQDLAACAGALAEAEAAEQGELQALEASQGSLGAAGADLEQAARRIELQEQELEARREELLEALQATSRVRNELVAAERELAAGLAERQRLDRQAGELAAQVQELEGRLAALDGRTGELEGEQQGLRRQQEALAAEVDTWRQRLSGLQRHLAGLQAECDRLAAEARLLERAQEDLEGYARGVRALRLGHGPWRARVLGPLAELVQVPADLEVAVAAALGSQLEAVVIETAEAAAHAIAFLREGRHGWATFLPLDFLRPRPVAAEVLQQLRRQRGWIGLVSELVASAPEVRPAVTYVGGRVAVVERLEDAVALGRGDWPLARIVTRQGEVVVPGGPVSGGQREHSRTEHLARRRRREAVLEALEARQAQLQELVQRRDEAVGRIAELEAGWRRLQQQEQVCQREAALLRAERDQTAARLRELAARRREVQALGQQQEERLNLLQQRRRQLGDELERLQAREQRWRSSLQALSDELSSTRQRRRELEAALVEAQRALERRRAALELVRARRHDLQEQHARLQRRREQLQAQAGEALREMERARQLGARLAEEVELAQRQLQALEHEDAQIGQRLEQLQQQLQAAGGSVGELEQSEQAASAALMRAERGWQQASLRLEQAERLWEQAGGGDPGLPGDPVLVGWSGSALRQEQARLRSELERVGPPDPGAIEAYEQARQSYAAAVADRDDVVGACQALERLQGQLESVCARWLLEAARQASDAFNALCGRLFGGGEGRLRLEGDQPLEGRLTLEVHPPAKRWLSAVALSGGERALAAAAFVLALQSVRPSPVCVMDELDAALDEANLERLVQVLVELSRERQFILITHRQRTMEAASALFGVTMDDSGVSRLVPLRLKAADARARAGA